MKKILSIFIVLIVLIAAAGCVGVNGGQNTGNGVDKNTVQSNNDDKHRVLVAVFSATGNTRQIADSAAGILNADLYVIVPEDPYTEEVRIPDVPATLGPLECGLSTDSILHYLFVFDHKLLKKIENIRTILTKA